MYEGPQGLVASEIVIRSQFDFAESFYEGLAFVENNYRQSFINPEGRVAIRSSSKRHLLGNFHCGLVPVSTKNGVGYLNKKGKIEIEPQFYHAEEFTHNRAIVSTEDDLYGIIDKSGKYVVPAELPHIDNFSEGLASFSNGTAIGYMDIHGNVIIEPQFDSASVFSCGLARVLKPKRKFCCYVDTYGEEVIHTRKYPRVGNFCEGLAAVRKKNLYGFMDIEGNEVVEPQYQQVNDFSEGFARVQFGNNKYGFIDYYGRVVVDGIYPEAQDFSEGVASVRLMYSWGVINRTGKFVVKPMFFEIAACREGFAAFCGASAWGYLNFI